MNESTAFKSEFMPSQFPRWNAQDQSNRRGGGNYITEHGSSKKTSSFIYMTIDNNQYPGQQESRCEGEEADAAFVCCQLSNWIFCCYSCWHWSFSLAPLQNFGIVMFFKPSFLQQCTGSGTVSATMDHTDILDAGVHVQECSLNTSVSLPHIV